MGCDVKSLVRTIAGLAAIAAFAAVGMFGTEYLLSRATPDDAEQPREGAPTRVGISQPEQRRIETSVNAVGTIMPVRSVEVNASVAGRITQVAVRSGDMVERDMLLVQLDDRAQRAEVAGAEATLAETRQTLRRTEELAQTDAAADQRVETAQAEFARAESDLLAARAALDDRRITAPFDGTLSLLDVDPGAYLTTQTVIATVADLSVVQVDLSLPERYYQQVSPGQSVEMTVPAYPDERFDGEVTVREAAIDPGSRSFDVRAQVENPDRRLVGGMFAQTRIVLDSYEGLAVPDDAIISEGSRTYVYTVTDGTANRRDVALGGSVGSLTEVTDGLDRDARIVISGWDNLRDGAPVEVAEDIADEGLQ